VEFRSATPKGYVLDRAGLDRWLLDRAAEAGATVRCPVAAVGVAGRVLRTTAGAVGFEVLVGADGGMSGVRRWAGLPPPAEILAGVQAIVQDASSGDEDGVEVHLGRAVAPGGFAWVVPAEEGLMRVGLLTSARRDGMSLLSRFLVDRCPANRVLRQESGLVPLGPPPRTVGEGILLVGDAAGQVKPLSGGGLLFGLIAAQIGGEIAALQPDRIGDYETRWRAEVGREIAFGLRGRQAFLSLTDGDLDRIVAALDRPDLRRLVAEEGDIDRPSGLGQAVLARPSAWPAVIPLVRALGGWRRARELALGLPSAAEPG
jgi:flavin-dependent dehydrogenase